VKELLARLTPPCRDVTRLTSESMDRPLPLMTRVKIRLHLMICENCRRYGSQLQALRYTLRRRGEDQTGTSASSGPQLSAESKERLKRALDAQRR
jgi:hypothetical protein